MAATGDGNSTGPAKSAPGTAMNSAVVVGKFSRSLDDDEVNLQLMNNHLIRELVEKFNAELAPLSGILENTPEEILTADPSLFPPRKTPANHANAIRAYNQTPAGQYYRAQDAAKGADALAAKLEDDIHAILQQENTEFLRLGSTLDLQTPTSTQMREQIARIDAQVEALTASLPTLQEFERKYFPGSGTGGTPGAAELDKYLTEIAKVQNLRTQGGRPISSQTLDGLRGARGTPDFTDYLNRFMGSYHGANRAWLEESPERLTNGYPEVYKAYEQIRAGQSHAKKETDWWSIATTVGWVIAEEAAWIAAGVLLAPVTGGVGTVILASARMARRAGAVGRMVAKGVVTGMNIARWYTRLEARVMDYAFRIFRNAWARVRGRVVGSKVRPGSTISGKGRAPRQVGCANQACGL